MPAVIFHVGLTRRRKAIRGGDVRPCPAADVGRKVKVGRTSHLSVTGPMRVEEVNMDLPIPLLVGIVAGISTLVGRIVWHLMRGKDAWGRERQHPEV